MTASGRSSRKGYPRVAQAAQGLPCSSSEDSPRTATSARVPASVIGPVRGPRSASTSSKRRVAGRRRPAPTRRCVVERPGFASLRCGLAIPTDYRLQGPHRSGRSPHLPIESVPFGHPRRGRRWRSYGETKPLRRTLQRVQCAGTRPGGRGRSVRRLALVSDPLSRVARRWIKRHARPSAQKNPTGERSWCKFYPSKEVT
jgi:hypothetical protein